MTVKFRWNESSNYDSYLNSYTSMGPLISFNKLSLYFQRQNLLKQLRRISSAQTSSLQGIYHMSRTFAASASMLSQQCWQYESQVTFS